MCMPMSNYKYKNLQVNYISSLKYSNLYLPDAMMSLE